MKSEKYIIRTLKQGITNTPAVPIDKMLYIYLLCPHSEHQKKIRSNLNTFTKETGSNKVKLPKVGSLWGAGPNKLQTKEEVDNQRKERV
jgi:hypothetical protein